MTAFLLVIACAKLPETHHGLAYDGLDKALAAGFVLSPSVVVADQPAPPLPPPHAPTEIEKHLLEGDAHLAPPTVLDPANPEIAAYLRNDFVGILRFGGGLVRMGETALEVRARLVEFHQGEELRKQGTAWLDAVVASLLGAGLSPVAVRDADAPPVNRANARGANELDGRDNVNLPRVTISPAAMAPAAEGPPYAVVPYLRAYYAHNGGWFIGQEWGCSGGARVEAMLVVYDRRTGQPAWWQVATGRHVEEMKAQPSRAQLDQYLLYAEAQVEESFERGFLR
ncbi:MAG: hypothetical protein FJ102_05510 [Deltaproteobacteria bacterium]|nr:hypothetical protein [Deltaproteobacteria bacterium]